MSFVIIPSQMNEFSGEAIAGLAESSSRQAIGSPDQLRIS
jgi:hypothetical protein